MRRVPLELAAHYAGVGHDTIHQWVHRGHIRHYADGYDLAEIHDWLERRDPAMAALAMSKHTARRVPTCGRV